MMIDDVIRNAESEYVIYFLLAAYIEAALFAAKLPEYVMNLPISGLNDVETRFQRLMMEFNKPAEPLPDKPYAVLQEALHVFDAALSRLKFLERGKESLWAFNLPGGDATKSNIGKGAMQERQPADGR